MPKRVEYDDPVGWDGHDWTGFYRVEQHHTALWIDGNRTSTAFGDMILVTCRADDYRWWHAVWKGRQVVIHESDLDECEEM